MEKFLVARWSKTEQECSWITSSRWRAGRRETRILRINRADRAAWHVCLYNLRQHCYCMLFAGSRAESKAMSGTRPATDWRVTGNGKWPVSDKRVTNEWPVCMFETGFFFISTHASRKLFASLDRALYDVGAWPANNRSIWVIWRLNLRRNLQLRSKHLRGSVCQVWASGLGSKCGQAWVRDIRPTRVLRSTWHSWSK